MSKQPGADELTLPIKRTDGETAEERLTDNAYYNILPARYLKKDANGDVTEQPEELFERVAKNIALAEAVFEARKRDTEVTATPDQLKPDHPRRDELAAEVFGTGVTVGDDVETTLTEHNVNKFSYETVVPELPEGLRDHVESIASAFQEQMEQLSFMPNCVPPDSLVAANGGMKPLSEVAPGERVYDDEDGLAEVEKKYANGEKTVVEVETAFGYSVRATPEHSFRVIADDGEYEWRQVQDIGPGDVLALQKNFFDDDSERTSLELPDSGSDHGRTRGRFDPPERMSPQLAEWLGLYVGDGTARESGVRVAFDEVDNDLVDHWATLTESVFGFEPTRHARSDAACVIGQASRRDLFDFLDGNGLLKETSDTAAVPPAVLRSGRWPVAAFLRGLFEADGTVGERSIELYTHSDALASQVQKLLLGLGIRSKVTEKHDGYRVTIRKNVCGRRFAERVGFLSERKTAAAERFKEVSENASSVKIPNQSERLHEWFQDSNLGLDAYRDLSQFLIDPDSDYHQEIGKGIFQRYAEEYPELRESPVADLVSRDQIYEEVSSVTEVGTMAVEDMKVPRRNTYVVEGFVSHNSPTLMNAGDELQQLSACFVDSPADDIDDIHQTAKEAAQVFQCLTDDTRVHVEGNGVVSIADVEPGDAIRQRAGDGYTFGTVEEVHAYDDAPTKTVVTEGNIELTGTPNHRLLVDGEWTQIEDVEPGDTVSVRLGWISDDDETDSLAGVDVGAQWSANRTVSNEEIADLHADGLSDYEIAERLDTSSSTVQRRRSGELDLPANGDGGRSPGRSFDEPALERLYEIGHTDTEVATELDVHATTVRGYRAAQSLEANGTAVKEVTQPTELSAELAELVGIWIGDGSVHEDGIRFHVNRDDVLNRIDSLSRSLFDIGVDYTWSDGCYEAVIHSHEIKRWWLSHLGDAKQSSADANVPDCIWNADHDGIYAFLRGLFSTDGPLSQSKYPRLYSPSEELVDGALQLLLGVGIPATKWSWQHESRDYYSVAPTDELGLSRFAESVGFVDTRTDEMLAELDRTTTGTTTTGTPEGETVWEQEVVAVEDGSEATVYDVTVEGNREYIASSVVSHNSGGGMGYAFWRLRPYGDPVGSTGGIASGPITFMRTYDQLCETIAQGGARRGAQMGVMRVSHPDVIQFIHAKNKDVSLANTLRLNDPDDFTHNSFAEALEEARDLIDDEGRVPEHLRNAVEGHLSNFNISVGITDRFMDAVKNDEMYTFTNPRTGEAHVATEQTEELYSMFDLDEYVEAGEVLSVPATELWDRIIEGAHENGEPGVIYLERVNKKHSFDVEEHPEHRILATNPSLAAGTRVLTDQGIVDIEELEGQRVEVPTASGEWADAICHRSGNDEALYEVELDNGKTYLATEEHKWPVLRDGSHKRIKTTDLESGHRLPIEHRESLRYGSVGDRDKGFLVGWLYGDGSVTHRKDGRTQYGFTFSEEDAVSGVMDRVLDTLEGITGVEYEPTERRREGEPWYEVHASHAALRGKMDEYGVGKKQEGVPEVVWSDASESFRKGFIDGLFSADGYVDGKENRIVLVSSQETLIKDVSDLLGFYGLKTSLRDTEVEKRDSSYERWDLKLSRTQAHRFRETFDLTHEAKAASLDDLKTPDRSNVRSDNAVVKAVRPAEESGPVWDLRVDEETHTFALSHAFTGNCGEQPLEEYEACNLGHINLSTLAAEDAPDWRVWQGEHADAYGTEDEAIEAFLAEAIDWEEFDRRIELGTRFLENVVTMSDFPVPEIEQKVREMRKIGLGIMGLAQLYIQLGMRYGSDAANETAQQLMVHINHQSKWTSHELAGERGSFVEWDNSKYADPTAYPDWFEHHTGLDAEEWADGFPIRNHNTTTIAPTGTTSMLGNTTGGCEPIYNVAYYKNVSGDVQGDEMLVEFDDYFLRTLEANDIDVEAVKREAQEQMAANEFDGVDGLTTVPDAIGELFVVTGDLSAKDHASVQTACQEGVDSAISKCLEEGTLVQTDSGVRPVESFADAVPEPGEFVDVEEDVTIDGVPVQSQYYAGEKDATRVRVDNGTELVGATESHKVLTPDGWRVLGDLEPGDHVIGRRTESHGDGNAAVAFPRGGAAMADGGATLAVGGADRSVHEKDVTVPSNMSPRLARFLGMYAADGSAIDDRYSIEISTASERVRDEARDLFEELFGREPSIDIDTRGGEERDTVYGVHLNSRPVWEFVTSLCGSGSYDKDVPRGVLQGSPEEKLAFVNGITLDGYVTDQSLVVYGGMSRDLADGVAELLRSFGVPKVYVGRKWVDESDAYAHQVHVTNDAQELVTPIEPHKRVDRFDQRYRVYVPQDRVDKTEFDSRSREYYAARSFEYRNHNYMFDTTAENLGITDAPPLYEVTDVEDAGTREMYDIELAGPHEYVVGGVVSHNTVNAPNDSTLADAKEVFEYIYDHGGKGVTYYRDGTRSKQVLTTRAQNTEFADEAEAAEALVAQIEEVFGGIEEFVESEEVRAVIDTQIEDLLGAVDGDREEFAQKQARPDVLHGVTQRIDTGYGKLYVNINEDPEADRPFELFANIGNSGGFTASFTEALAKTISTALRAGVDPHEIAEELQGIRSPKVAWDKGEQIQSIPDAIGTAMRRYLEGDVERAYPQQQTLEETAEEAQDTEQRSADDIADVPETDGGAMSATSPATTDSDQQELIEAGENPECPECGSLSVYYSEGCKTCESCGWSEC